MWLALLLSSLTLLLLLSALLLHLLYRQLRLPLTPHPPPAPPTFTPASERSLCRGPTHAFPSSPSPSPSLSSPPPAPTYDVIIIGSGLGGLTAASLLSSTHRTTLTVEQHDTAGGCTHTWQPPSPTAARYAVGVHYVGGDVGNPHSPFRATLDLITGGRVAWTPTWLEEETTPDDPPMSGVYDVVHFGPHRRVLVRAGIRRWLTSAIDAFPGEEAAIRRYLSLTLRIDAEASLHFLLHNLLPLPLYRLLAPLLLPTFRRYTNVTTQAYLTQLTPSLLLRSFLSYIHFDYGSLPSHSSFVAHAVAQVYFLRGTAYPVGGPSQLAKAAVAGIEARGGKVIVRSAVSSIIIEGGRAVGVRLEGGREVRAREAVVSAVGARRTLLSLITAEDRALVAPQVRALTLEGAVEGVGLGQAAAHFSLFFTFEGDADALHIPLHNTIVLPDDDVDGAGERWAGPSARSPPPSLITSADEGGVSTVDEEPPLSVAFITFACRKDPTAAAREPGVISGQVLAEGRFEWVERLRAAGRGGGGRRFGGGRDGDGGEASVEYERMKARMRERLLGCVLTQFPQLRGQRVVHCELGTPLSSEWFLGADKGSSYGMCHSVDRVGAEWLRCRVDGVQGLYLAGTDVVMAGLEGAVMGGALAAASIDKRLLWRHLNAIVGTRVWRKKVGTAAKRDSVKRD